MKHSNALPGDSLPADIESAAVQWLGLRDAGQMTVQQEAEFAAWLDADKRHVAAYSAISQMWDGLGGIRNVIPVTGAADPDLLAPIATPLVPLRRRAWRMLPSSLAAAAALTIGLLIWRQPAAPALLTKAAATHIGGQRTVDLPDGSKVRLNTDTEIRVHFAVGERQVRLLRGEAHFTVAKDRIRPFIVGVGNISVRAVGTEFNVRLDSRAVEVLVTEGKVRVDDSLAGNSLVPSTPAQPAVTMPSAERLLVAGRRLIIELNSASAGLPSAALPAIAEVTPAEIMRALAWREGRLEFEDSSLAEVIAEFNRYNTHKLVIEDSRLNQERFGGKFRPDGHESLVRLLESSFGVQVERRSSETVLRLP